MYRILLLFTLNTSLTLIANAQVTPLGSNKQTIVKIRELQTELLLSNKQRKDLYEILVYQSILEDSIKNHTISNPTKRQQIINQLRSENIKIDSLLTPNQRTIYLQWKQSNRLKTRRI